MPSPASTETHAQVAHFLERYGYTSTLEAFRREAGPLVPATFDPIADDNDDTLTAHLAPLQLDSSPQHHRLEEGDFDFYTTLIHRHTDFHATNILSVSCQPSLIATSSTDKTVKLHSRTDPPALLRTYQHHQAPVLSIDFHPRLPQLMLTTSMDGTVVLVDTQADDDDDAVMQRFKDHQRYVVRGVFSPGTGRFFATASYDRTLCIYKDNTSEGDKASYELVAKRGPYVGNVETLVFSPDGTTLIAGIQNDHCLHVIHLDDADLAQRGNDTKVNLNANGDDWVSFSPTWLSFHPTGGLLMVSTDHASGRLILLDPFHGGKQIQNYHIASASDTTFTTRRHAFHPSGRYFYVIGGDTHHTVKVVETKTGHLEATLDGGHDKMIKAIVHDPWVGGLWTAGFDHTLALWSTQAAMDDLLR